MVSVEFVIVLIFGNLIGLFCVMVGRYGVVMYRYNRVCVGKNFIMVVYILSLFVCKIYLMFIGFLIWCLSSEFFVKIDYLLMLIRCNFE